MQILVADDHTLFREGLRYILRDLDAEARIDEAETAQEAMSVIGGAAAYDLMLLDLNMPGMDGLVSLRGFVSAAAQCPVVVLSASEHRTDARAAFKAGAKGYIPKSSSREVMVNALRLVLSGGTYLPPFLLEAEAAAGAPQVAAVEEDDLNTALTPRQVEVLNCLAEGKSNKEIARQLGLAEGTVKIHIAGILKALKVNNRTQAVIVAGKMRENSGQR